MSCIIINNLLRLMNIYYCGTVGLGAGSFQWAYIEVDGSRLVSSIDFPSCKSLKFQFSFFDFRIFFFSKSVLFIPLLVLHGKVIWGHRPAPMGQCRAQDKATIGSE